MNHIKPHGALYGMAARNEEVAHAVCDAADVYGVPVLGMKKTVHEEVYTERGHTFIAEFYADLDYNDDGGLIITREHDPVDLKQLHRDACERLKKRNRFGQRYKRRSGFRLYLRAFGHAERDRSGRGGS